MASSTVSLRTGGRLATLLLMSFLYLSDDVLKKLQNNYVLLCSMMQGWNAGAKSTRPKGLKLKMFTGQFVVVQYQNHIEDKFTAPSNEH